MLFQPSNILPDIINGVGNGTVDIENDGLIVSWQINGNSKMTGYKIEVCKNNIASDVIYNSDQITSSEDSNLPASPVDPLGNIQRFTAITITYEMLEDYASLHGTTLPTNGHQYKIKITQYYSGGSIVQRSLSVFKTRTTPTVAIGTISRNILERRERTFTATYTQSQGDAISWARWQVYNVTGEQEFTSENENDLIADTGKLYSVTELEYYYKGFINNSNYNIVLTVQTENGIIAKTSYQFETRWSTVDIPGTEQGIAVRKNTQSTAVSVSWSGFNYIPGKVTGDVEIKNGVARMQDGSGITWDEKNGLPLNIGDPWMITMSTRLAVGDVSKLLVVDDTNGNNMIDSFYDLHERKLYFNFANVNQIIISEVGYDNGLTMMVMPPTDDVNHARFLIRIFGEIGRLVPYNSSSTATSLYANIAQPTTLIGVDITTPETYKYTFQSTSEIVENVWYSIDLQTQISESMRERYIVFKKSGAASDEYAAMMDGNPMKVGDIPQNGNYAFRVVDNTFELVSYIGNGLYPSEILPPNAEHIPFVIIKEYDISGFSQDGIGEISTSGKQVIDYIEVITGDDYVTDEVANDIIERAIENGRYDPEETPNNGTEFLASFNETADASAMTIGGVYLTGWAVYREHKLDGTSIHLLDVPIYTDNLLDFGCGSNWDTYRYLIYPIGQEKYISQSVKTNWIKPVFENWAVIEAEKTDDGYYKVLREFVFGKNLNSGGVGNNNSPTVSKNFTRYATVQMDNANYQSGTLSSLIGYIGFVSYIIQDGDTWQEIANRYNTTVEKIVADNDSVNIGEPIVAGKMIKIFYEDGFTAYGDDRKLRDAIWDLSTTKYHLFLKSRKGDVIEIRTAGDISMQTQDNSPLQPITVSLPWVQIGDAFKTSIIGGFI